MKKIKVFMGIIFLIIMVVLSGCQEKQTDTNNKGNGAEIISYSVITTWRDSEYNEKSGFYHDISDNAIYTSQYIINGLVKNTANKDIDEIYITAVFYDVNNTELYSTDKTKGIIQNLLMESTRNFTFRIDFYDSEYYSNFDHVDFEISIL